MNGWHFVQVDEEGVARLRYGDNRRVVAGEWLCTRGGNIMVCGNGLHASLNLGDALYYAGLLDYKNVSLCSVELRGDISYHGQVAVARMRYVKSMISVDETIKWYNDLTRFCGHMIARQEQYDRLVLACIQNPDHSERAAVLDAIFEYHNKEIQKLSYKTTAQFIVEMALGFEYPVRWANPLATSQYFEYVTSLHHPVSVGKRPLYDRESAMVAIENEALRLYHAIPKSTFQIDEDLFLLRNGELSIV